MVQVDDECAVSSVEVQENPVRVIGASVRVKFFDVPFRLADSTSEELALTAEKFAVNPALVEPGATKTDAGIETFAVPPTNATFAPPEGACTDKPTVQVAEPGVVTVDGVQERDEIVGSGGARASVNVSEVEFRLAASTAVVFALTVDAIAVNPAEFEPAGITMDDGIVTVDPDATPVVTLSPPAGAGAETVMVHAVEPGVVMVAGEQVSPLAVYGEVTVTWPPVAETLTSASLIVTPVLFNTWIADVPPAAGDTVKVAVATTPLLSVVLLKPNSRQV
jgi:hypothetical protein